MLNLQRKENLLSTFIKITHYLPIIFNFNTKQSLVNKNIHLASKIMENVPTVIKSSVPRFYVELHYVISLNALLEHFNNIIKSIHSKILIIKGHSFRTPSDMKILDNILNSHDYDTFEKELYIAAFYAFYELLCFIQRLYPNLSIEEILRMLLGLINGLDQKDLDEALKRRFSSYKRSLAFYIESYLKQLFYKLLSNFTRGILTLLKIFKLIKTWLYNLLLKFFDPRYIPSFLLEFRTLIILYYFYFRRKRGRLRDLIIREFVNFGKPPRVIYLPDK